MTPPTFTIPDGTMLTQARERDGRLFGVDPVTDCRCTYDGDDAGGRLVDSAGNVVREVSAATAAETPARKPQKPLGRQGAGDGPSTRQRQQAGGSDAGRWHTLNAFVDGMMSQCTEAEVRVWLAIYREVKPGGLARIGMGQISKVAGIERRSVVRAMDALKRRGVVEVVTRGTINGTPNAYRLHTPT
jgi:hypothetical protein